MRRKRDMTVPEESSPKTHTTDDVVAGPDRREDIADRGEGRSMREALEEAGITPETVEEGE
jgi:hypothetical protein